MSQPTIYTSLMKGDSGCKYKSKKHSISTTIRYYEPDDFDEIKARIERSGRQANIIGSFAQEHTESPEKSKGIAVLDNAGVYFDIIRSTGKGKTLGYVQVGEEDFVRMYRSRLLVILFILLLLVLIGGIIFLSVLKLSTPQEDTPKDEPLTVGNGVVYDPQNPNGIDGKDHIKEASTITFPGFANIRIPEGRTFNFHNPKENDVSFIYNFYNADEMDKTDESKGLIVRTDPIPPGGAASWDIRQELKTGKHNLYIRIDTRSIYDQTPRNNMEFTIEVDLPEE